MHAKIFGSVLVAYRRAHKHAKVGEERKHSNDTIQTRRLLLSSTLSPPHITLLSDSELDTLALRQGYPGLGALTDDEDVGDTNGVVSHETEAI